MADLYPEVEGLYEHVDGRVFFEADVPDELDVVGRRVVGGGDVDLLALERHRHEVGNADDQRDKVDKHDRQPRTTDAAPDGAVTRVPNEQVPTTTHTRRPSRLLASNAICISNPTLPARKNSRGDFPYLSPQKMCCTRDELLGDTIQMTVVICNLVYKCQQRTLWVYRMRENPSVSRQPDPGT